MPAIDAFWAKQSAYSGMRSEYWPIFAKHFSASLRGEYDGTIGIEGYEETAQEMTERLAHTLDLAETFYCAPLMNRLVQAAAEDWPADEEVHAEDFPSDAGWLLIPGGLTTVDIRGRLLTTSAISWRARGAFVELTFWANKKHDPPSTRNKEGWALMSEYTPWHFTRLTFGRHLPTSLTLGTVLPPEISDAIVWAETPQGMVASFPQGWSPAQLAPHMAVDGTAAWLVSMLRIMQQPLASIEHQGLPANVRKALRREKYRVSTTRVTIIDFRRRLSDFEGHSEREYTHRFLRRGHWRRQPYKRDDGTWDRRRIWIHATIVGDPSLPLVLRDHVNALRR